MENKKSLHRILDDGEVVLSKRGILVGFILLPVYMIGLSLLLSFVSAVIEVKLGYVISNLYFNLIFYAIMLAIVLLVFGKYLLASFKRAIKQRPKYIWLLTVYLGYFGILSFNMVSRLVVGIFKTDPTSVNQDTASSYAEESLAIMMFMSCLCAPIIEEVFFRGLLFRGLMSRKHKWTAIPACIISALLFAGMHVYPAVIANQDITELVYLASYLPMGIIFAVCVYKTKNIFSGILLHAVNNIVATLLPLMLQYIVK